MKIHSNSSPILSVVRNGKISRRDQGEERRFLSFARGLIRFLTVSRDFFDSKMESMRGGRIVETFYLSKGVRSFRELYNNNNNLIN